MVGGAVRCGRAGGQASGSGVRARAAAGRRHPQRPRWRRCAARRNGGDKDEQVSSPGGGGRGQRRRHGRGNGAVGRGTRVGPLRPRVRRRRLLRTIWPKPNGTSGRGRRRRGRRRRHRPCRRRRGPNGRDGRRSGAVSGRGDHPSSRQQTSRGTCRKRPTERLPGPGSPRPPAAPVRRQRATGDRSVVFTSGACAARARTCAGVRGGRPRGGPGAIRLTPVNNHSFVF